MAADLTAIRTGIAANLGTIAGVTVSPYVLSNPTMPVIWVRPAFETLVDYHEAMRDGLETWSLLVQAYTGALGDVDAQKNLDAFVSSTGTQSIKKALETDRTLGGAAADLIVELCRGYQEYTRPDGGTLLGAEWVVLVRA